MKKNLNENTSEQKEMFQAAIDRIAERNQQIRELQKQNSVDITQLNASFFAVNFIYEMAQDQTT